MWVPLEQIKHFLNISHKWTHTVCVVHTYPFMFEGCWGFNFLGCYNNESHDVTSAGVQFVLPRMPFQIRDTKELLILEVIWGFKNNCCIFHAFAFPCPTIKEDRAKTAQGAITFECWFALYFKFVLRVETTTFRCQYDIWLYQYDWCFFFVLMTFSSLLEESKELKRVKIKAWKKKKKINITKLDRITRQ